jgi:GAF domain-containing protein
VGTVWINAHDPMRKFDQEDARLLKSLARFASAGYQTITALSEAKDAQVKLERTGSRSMRRMELPPSNRTRGWLRLGADELTG